MTLASARAVSADLAAGPKVTRILLRTPKDPFQVASPGKVFRDNLIAQNVGNLVFLQAAWKLLDTPGVTLEPDGLRTNLRPEEVNERYHVYVIPLANAFRISYESQLLELTAMIRRLRIPVVVLGVGAQADLDGSFERLRPIEASVRAFVDAVLDHAPSIGVRGATTHAYLRSLGYRDVEVIGCPSMFLHGPAFPMSKRLVALGPDARLALNVSPYVKAMGPIVARHVARYPNLVYYPQDVETLGMLVHGSGEVPGSMHGDIPDHLGHPLFQQDRVRFPLEPWPWMDDLRTMDFAFGTRIHGNIAALLAGTPAYVLAHDSRTLELARWFGIPHRLITETDATLDAADLYAEADYTELVEGHAARFATFQAYLRRHGLADCFTDGDGGAAFDEKVARTTFPPAVRFADQDGAQGTDVLAGRIRYRLRRLARKRPVLRLRAAVRRARAGRALRRS